MFRRPRIGNFRRADVNKAHPFQRGCTLWYPMGDGAGQSIVDFSGLRRDGTISYSHATAALPWRAGVDNRKQALHFEGLDPTAGPEGGRVEAPNLAATFYVTAAAGAMSAWVRCEGTVLAAPSAGRTSGIVCFAPDTAGAAVGLMRGGLSVGPVADSLWACAVNSSSTAKAINLGSVASLSGGWHHVWMSWSGGFLIGGIDGAQTGSIALAGAGTVSFLGGGTRIGKGDSIQFNGAIADVRIYNRALAADEDVRFLYSSPSAAFLPSRKFYVMDLPGLLGDVLPGPTFAEAAANRSQDWTMLLTVEGVGQAEGLWKFCNQIPDYAAAASDAATYKDWLEETSWPKSLSEEVDELGGIPKCGELGASIVDVDDLLVAKLRVDQAPITRLDGPLSKSATSVVVLDGSGIVAGDVIFIRNEAILVTVVVGPTLTLTRAQLDTEAQAHEDGSAVFEATPYLRSRIMRLRMAPKNASDSSQETVLATSYLDRIGLSGNLNCWELAGRSQLKFLSRQVCGQVMRYQFVGFSYLNMKINGGTGGHERSTRDPRLWSDHVAFFKLGDELLRAEVPNATGSLGLLTAISADIKERGVAGTKEDDHKPGEQCIWVLNGTEEHSSFRYSPAPSPSADRATGTWIVSNTGSGGVHFVDAMLCVLTSSARYNDGLELTNYDQAFGNWSSLPAGFGVGVPYTLIDFASFIDVKARTPSWTFPNLILGDETIPFADWVEKNFLKPLGLFMTCASGQIRLVMPRAPLADETSTEWDFTVALRDRDDSVGLVSAPELRTDVASSVTFKLKSSLGDDVTETINSADAAQFYSQSGYYALDEQAVEFDLPGARADQVGFDGFVRQLGLRRLYKLSKPRWTLKLRTDLAQYAVNPGDSVAITHPQLPDLRTGTRGWTSVPMMVLEKTLSLAPEFFGYEWVLSGPGPDAARHGRLCGSANITAVSGSGPYVCTVSANRYTSPDAADGLPQSDAAAFAAGFRVRLVNRDGSAAAAVYTTVSAVGANTISLSSNFLGALAAGKQLVFGGSGDTLPSAQSDVYVYFADGSDFTIGATDTLPWAYGE